MELARPERRQPSAGPAAFANSALLRVHGKNAIIKNYRPETIGASGADFANESQLLERQAGRMQAALVRVHAARADPLPNKLLPRRQPAR